MVVCHPKCLCFMRALGSENIAFDQVQELHAAKVSSPTASIENGRSIPSHLKRAPWWIVRLLYHEAIEIDQAAESKTVKRLPTTADAGLPEGCGIDSEAT
ncbi:hypothetical protein GGE24_007728 [Bradyrhizobium centrosematis]|nr:hypothetical protein [Bradyrhizobium centrosematis]